MLFYANVYVFKQVIYWSILEYITYRKLHWLDK
jgi:hypothetical protein